jgi:sigma-B regulation protein RsbU (phosphoserine phosphatase)
MEGIALSTVRDQLLDRRQKLETAVATIGETDDMVRLLRDVDAALARVNVGTFGLCETCHDPIEPDRLLADPLTRFCIDHLTPGEQRALEHDLQLAARIQRELLPRPETCLDGWEFAYHYQPATTVSGDYCDLITGTSGTAHFLVGDVAGHGIAAAMLMSNLSATLRTLISLGISVTELMERANRVFCETTIATHYATLVCGRASASGDVEVANAGHPPPLLLHRDSVIRLDATGLPVGMFCTGRYASSTVQLASGDTLLMYTDGLIEAQDSSGEPYGIDRVAALVSNVRLRHDDSGRAGFPKTLVEACVRDVTAFRGAAHAEDDLTLFAISRL